MNQFIQMGNSIVFMKIGVHAREPLEEIIQRKSKEIKDTGYAYWGYGGNTCHPRAVQPFAVDSEKKKQTIFLLMHQMDSHHYAEQIRADEYSIDGVTWRTIPPKINVLGSRFALVIDSLEAAGFELPLERTKVAVGNCAGRPGNKYIVGRVDKACLEIAEPTAEPLREGEETIHIGLTARLREPYAVFLRNKP